MILILSGLTGGLLASVACGEDPVTYSDDDDDADVDTGDDNDSTDDDDTDSALEANWFGCADLEDCVYLCLEDDSCAADCADRTMADSLVMWHAYRQCSADHCGDHVEDSAPYTECMNTNCFDEKQGCAGDRGHDPDYVKVGPDSNEIGELATNVFWYDADDSLFNLRDHFYREKKAIVLEFGAIW